MKKCSTFSNAAWIIFCRIIQAMLSLFVGMWTARYLGPSNYGLINYASSLAAFVAPIAYLGINEVLVLDIVNNPDDEGKTVGTAISISLMMAVLCMIAIMIFVQLTSQNEVETKVVCAFYNIALIFRTFQIAQYWFQAKLLSKYTSVASILVYIAVSAFKIYLVVTGKSILWFVACCLLDEALIMATTLLLYHRLGGERLSFSKTVAFRLISKSKNFIVPNLMITIFAQTDRIMLKLMIDNAAAGIYSAAMTCANMSSFVFVAIIDSFRPSIFSWRKSNIEIYETRIKQLNSIVIYLSICQCVGFMVLAKPVIYILYGSEYMEAAAVLQVLIWYTLFSYLGAVRNIWVLAEEREKYLWVINVAGVLLNVTANYMLIPIYGPIGAAVASLLTQFVTNVVICTISKPYRHGVELMIAGLHPKYILELLDTRKGG